MVPLLEEVGTLQAGRLSPLALFHRYQPMPAGAWGEAGNLLYQGALICRRDEPKLLSLLHISEPTRPY